MHFLQSEAWQNFQKELGRKTFRQSGDGWEYLAILEQGQGNSRLYCPYGPSFGSQKSFKSAIKSLTELGKKLNVTFVRIEPTDTAVVHYLQDNHWRKVDYQSLNPEHTVVVDLSPSIDEIISRMAQTNRNIYRNYSKKGIALHSSTSPNDINIFLDLIKKVATRTGMKPHSDGYFTAQAKALFPLGSAKLFYATLDGAPISASIIYDSETTRYYAHAGSDSDYRKLNSGNALVAEMIVDAKRKGLKSFDLYGIAPDNAPSNHPWAGFTSFKRGFGGVEMSFAGSWDLPIKQLPYSIYLCYQKLYHSIRSR